MDWLRFSNPYARKPHAKSQGVRVLDVAVIGPLMVWGGARAAASGAPLAGAVLALFGVTTVAYNAVNYGRVERGEAC